MVQKLLSNNINSAQKAYVFIENLSFFQCIAAITSKGTWPIKNRIVKDSTIN